MLNSCNGFVLLSVWKFPLSVSRGCTILQIYNGLFKSVPTFVITNSLNDCFLILDKKKLKLDVEPDLLNGDGGEKPEETIKSEIFRCETCGATFKNLLLFMDHKNTQCDTGMRSVLVPMYKFRDSICF